MSNPVLLSESFERAAYSLRDSLDQFASSIAIFSSVHRIEQAAEKFEASVDRLVEANATTDAAAATDRATESDLAEAAEAVGIWVDLWADDQAELDEDQVSLCDLEERKVIAAVRLLLQDYKRRANKTEQ